MRKHVKEAIEEFRLSENNLLGIEWHDIYFEDCGDTRLVKDVIYQDLCNKDLLRFLLYLTKQQDQAILKRLRESSY